MNRVTPLSSSRVSDQVKTSTGQVIDRVDLQQHARAGDQVDHRRRPEPTLRCRPAASRAHARSARSVADSSSASPAPVMPLLKPHSPRLRARAKNAYELPLSQNLPHSCHLPFRNTRFGENPHTPGAHAKASLMMLAYCSAISTQEYLFCNSTEHRGTNCSLFGSSNVFARSLDERKYAPPLSRDQRL